MEEIKMKDSGIKWIGKIPEDWDVKRLKYCVDKFGGGGTPESSNDEFYDDEHGVNWVAIGDMSTKEYVEDTDRKVTELGIKDKQLTIYPKGTIIYSIYATIGKVAELKIPATINQALLAIIENKKILNKNYLKKYLNFLENIVLADTSTNTQANLNLQKVQNFIICLPSLIEQQKIADFLDKKCANIDEIISKTEKQIEALQQYKDSLITEAITKGLKNEELKKVNHSWFKKLPHSWKLMKMKLVTSVLTCGVASTPDYVDEDEGVLFLSAQNIQNGKLDMSIKKFIPHSLHKQLTKYKKPQNGDILQVRVGATIGKSAIVNINDEFSVYVSLTHIRANDYIQNKFLNYVLNTDLFRKMCSIDIDFAGSQGNLNVADLKEYKVPVPPVEEQKEISRYLDKKCTKIDYILNGQKESLENLKKYKQSLIYEYVTGKKRV